jgi:ribosome-binding protein aMBF1 (putative translation factor)
MMDIEDVGSIINCHGEPGSKVSSPPASPRCGQLLEIVLGQRLRWMRRKRGLSLKALSSRLGWPVKRISQHERGTRRMHPDELIAYARLYRVRISSFFRDLFAEEP